MAQDIPVRRTPLSLWWSSLGIVMTTPFLVWFAIGELPFRGNGGIGPSRGYGPYEVGSASGNVLGGLAEVAAFALTVLFIHTLRGVAKKHLWVVVSTLSAAGALGAVGWRILTAGGVGSNIGDGFVLLGGPTVIAGLVFMAVWFDAESSGFQTPKRTRLLFFTTVLVAPALYLVLLALAQYDASAGFITARQYADVQIGQTVSTVHQALGREGVDLTYIFFLPAAPGLSCDFYSEMNGNHVYEFCFRAEVLVSKNLGTRPAA